MNPFNFQHSLKNVPLPSHMQYRRMLISSIEKFITRLRWDLIHRKNKTDSHINNNYGFKTTAKPRAQPELTAFEDDLFQLAKDVEFRAVNNPFQTELRQHINEIRNSSEIIVKADKSSNLYKVPVDSYKKLVDDNVTATYKLSSDSEVKKVNREAAKISKKLKIHERVDRYIESNAFVTIKDHKENFPGRVQCRLLNPAKSNIGKISKKILADAVKKIKVKAEVNLWRNSTEVIDWFSKIQNKRNVSFLKFDVVQFYPSISEDLFSKALDWTKTYYTFSMDDLEIIHHSRKSFLFHNKKPFVKKNNPNFDIAMGAFDGAECCELVGLFMLHKLKNLIKKENIGLYRDDGLAVVEGSGPEVDRIRKKVEKVFKEVGLGVTAVTNMKSTDFLDIFFDLESESYKPFRKNEDVLPVYINNKSNHPKTTKKTIPDGIAKRISNLSASKQVFDQQIAPYKTALSLAGYNKELIYTEHKKKKNRHRKIVWFNPPHSDNVKTNVGSKFLKLVDKHFKRSNLANIYNRKTIKISYSCMNNMESIISNHNRKLLQNVENSNQQTRRRECNCSDGVATCPVNGKCLHGNIIYKAAVTTVDDNQTFNYIGQTGNNFKERYNNHNSDFESDTKHNSTVLAKHIWKLNHATPEPRDHTIEWSIAHYSQSYSPESKRCQLCNLEKTLILFDYEQNLLNERSELMNKCPHRRKYLLMNYLN